MYNHSNSKTGSGGRGFHLDEHLILDFLLGFLSSAEKEKILTHLTDCPTCEKLFQERAAEAERLDATRVLRFLPDGELAVERRGTTVRENSVEGRRLLDFLSKIWDDVRAGFRRPRFQLAGGLAVVTALFLIVWTHGIRTPGEPNLYLLRPYSFELQSRDVQDAVQNEELMAGLDAYNKKEFKRAIELIQKAKISEQTPVYETIRKVYLGSALAWNKDYNEAIEVLETIPFPLVPPEWSHEAHWTLYVALKETGRDASADSMLQILAGKSGKVGERARRLLQ